MNSQPASLVGKRQVKSKRNREFQLGHQRRVHLLAQAIAHSRVVMLAGGHRLHSDHPDALLEAALPFLAGR